MLRRAIEQILKFDEYEIEHPKNCSYEIEIYREWGVKILLTVLF
jgi:hypothetical protein